MDILQLPSAWRGDWQPARFGRAYFHVDVNAYENGRRIVEHEFPKKEIPYAEDMGRRAFEITVVGYVIQYPFDGDRSQPNWRLYQRDYRLARDELKRELETGGSKELQLPTFPLYIVVCPRWRMKEERERGGYCEFEMQFLEAGKKPLNPTVNTAQGIVSATQSLQDAAVAAYMLNPNLQKGAGFAP